MLYLYTLQLEKLEKKGYKLYMNQIKPMLLTTLKSYDRSQFVKDVTAGIIVAIIALPLSIALALASGVGPQAGIFTAIVAGFVISAFGGSNVQIAGPTAAFATIVAGIVAKDGLDGLVISTILAGIFLILMGLCHFGSLIKFIPYTITTGFTSGIAVTIVIGQLKDFFGVTYPNGLKPIETMEKLNAFALGFSSFHVDALIVGGVSLAILIISPYIFKRIPGSLIAVVIGILMVKFLPLHVSTIGNLYTITNDLPSFHIPAVKFSMVKSAIPNAFTIAVLAAIESLLSCVVADGMINGKHRSDTELVAQGTWKYRFCPIWRYSCNWSDRKNCCQYQKWRPHSGCWYGPFHYFGHRISCFNAICWYDPNAYDRGHPFCCCLQYVSVENFCTYVKNGSKKRYHRVDRHIHFNGCLRSCRCDRNRYGHCMSAVYQTHE